MFSTKIILDSNTLNSVFYGIANGNSNMHLYTLQCHFKYRYGYLLKIGTNRVFSIKRHL